MHEAGAAHNAAHNDKKKFKVDNKIISATAQSKNYLLVTEIPSP
jgi:hypothetical protein